jgi:hypothetical protein
LKTTSKIFIQDGWYKFELAALGTQPVETFRHIIPLDIAISERLTRGTFHALDLLPFCTKSLDSQQQIKYLQIDKGET